MDSWLEWRIGMESNDFLTPFIEWLSKNVSLSKSSFYNHLYRNSIFWNIFIRNKQSFFNLGSVRPGNRLSVRYQT